MRRYGRGAPETDALTIVKLFAVAVGIGLVVISPLIKKLMHLDTLRDDDGDDIGSDLAGQAQAGLEPQQAGMHPATNPPGAGDQRS